MAKSTLSLIARRLKQEIKRRQMRKIFTRIYETNKWRDGESRSGPGSNSASTATLQVELPRLLGSLEVHSMLDIPCGDFAWMKAVDYPLERYIGADIVKEVADRNAATYALPGREFACLDLTRDALPAVDLIFCRDCLVHLPLKDVALALRNIKKSNSRLLALTTFSDSKENTDIVAPGEWRKLNFLLAPFCFPEAVQVFNEKYPPSPDKCIAVWRIADLPDF
jgi:hypothetical protein